MQTPTARIPSARYGQWLRHRVRGGLLAVLDAHGRPAAAAQDWPARPDAQEPARHPRHRLWPPLVEACGLHAGYLVHKFFLPSNAML